jgi:hypothetical protein
LKSSKKKRETSQMVAAVNIPVTCAPRGVGGIRGQKGSNECGINDIGYSKLMIPLEVV